MDTTSPVRSQPPGSSTAAVSPGLFQYPWNTCGPLTSSSPGSPGATSVCGSSSSTTRTSVEGKGTPMVPGFRVLCRGLPRATGEDSVIP